MVEQKGMESKKGTGFFFSQSLKFLDFKTFRRVKSSIFLSLLLIVQVILVPFSLFYISRVSPETTPNKLSDEEFLSRDILSISDFSYVNNEKSLAYQKELLLKVPPVFEFSVTATDEAYAKLRTLTKAIEGCGSLFDYLEQFYPSFTDNKGDVEELREKSKTDLFLQLFRESFIFILEKGVLANEQVVETFDILGKIRTVNNFSGFSKIPAEEIRNVYEFPSVNSFGNNVADNFNYDRFNNKAVIKEIVRKLSKDTIVPNLLFSEIEYNHDLLEVKKSFRPIVEMVKKGDVIAVKGERVTAELINKYNCMIDGENQLSVVELASRTMIIVIITISFLSLYVNFSYFKIRKRSSQSVKIMVLSLIISLFWISFSYKMSAKYFLNLVDGVLPTVFVPLVVGALISKRLAFFTLMYISSIVSFLPYSNTFSTLFILIFTVVMISEIKFDLSFFYSLKFLFKYSLFFIVISALEAGALNSTYREIYDYALNCLLMFILNYFMYLVLAIIFNKVFNLPTNSNLNKFIYNENKLLNDFSSVCPGSYAHSMNVAQIAEAAADELNLNSKLLRCAAMLHDLGKMEHPEYFVENQTEGNKHDLIKSAMSVAIIRGHVTKGVERAKEMKVPQEVIDLIAEHHGDDIIRFFYYEAQKENKLEGNNEDVDKTEYSYSGQSKPQTKESGILMICDSCEAAVRSKNNFKTPQEIRDFVQKIIIGKITAGQLSETGLSINEIDQIAKVISVKLIALNHHRISYPDEDK